MFGLNFLLRPFITLTLRPSLGGGSFSIPNGIILLAAIPFLKSIYHSRVLRTYLPWTSIKNQQLKHEISEILKKNSSDLLQTPKVEVPKLSLKAINQLSKTGFLNSLSDEKIEIKETASEYTFFSTEKLGSGSFGIVYLGQEINTGNWVAIKKQGCPSLGHERDHLKEAKYLAEQNQLLGFHQDRKTKSFYTIMPLFVRDDLYSNPLSEKIDFVIAFAKAIQQLHDSNRVHNDLHEGNICWNKKTKICKIIDHGSITAASALDEITSYSVPRMFNNQPPEYRFAWLNLKAGDIYAFGCLIESVLANTPALKNIELIKFQKRLKSKWWPNRPSADETVRFFESIRSQLLEMKVEVKPYLNNEKVRMCQEEIEKIQCKIKIRQDKITKLIQAENVDFRMLALQNYKLNKYKNYLKKLKYITIPSSYFFCDVSYMSRRKKKFEFEKQKYLLFKYQLNPPNGSISFNLNQRTYVPGLDLEITPIQGQQWKRVIKDPFEENKKLVAQMK